MSTEFHHFSDASTVGYGRCSYLRLVDNQQRVHCSLVMAKARVAPRIPVTIPQLELTAALASVKVSSLLLDKLAITNLTEWFWTDSNVVHGYISNDSRRFHATKCLSLTEYSRSEIILNHFSGTTLVQRKTLQI